MIMVAILTWGKDLVFQQAQSVEAVHALRRRLGGEGRDFIIYDAVFLCPIKLDHATRELDEEEREEFLRGTAYPALVEEGRLIRKNGKFRAVKRS